MSTASLSLTGFQIPLTRRAREIFHRGVQWLLKLFCKLCGANCREGVRNVMALVGGGLMFHAMGACLMEAARNDRLLSRGSEKKRAVQRQAPPIVDPPIKRKSEPPKANPVDEASLESFPASDPPAWNSSVAMPTEQEPRTV